MRYAVIIAGGTGTRLWPLSRADRPKQLLRIMSGEDGQRVSLLELAARRLDGVVDPGRRYICTGERYRGAIREVMPEFGDEQILGEPVGRDTVNAVGFAAAVLQKQDPDAVFAVLTADHIIEPVDVFRQRIGVGFELVERDPMRLVTFSIRPTHAATGYGYVERGRVITGEGLFDEIGNPVAYRVARFVEKPDQPRAEAYFRSGHFGWNSGMFVFNAGTFLYLLRRFKPESYDGLMRVQEAWAGPRSGAVLEEVYPGLPRISVDYAIMEPATKEHNVPVCTVEMPVAWMDVGNWPSYGRTLPSDTAGNRSSGDTVMVDARNNLVVSDQPGHTVALLGARDLIVVHTSDVTLVVPRDQAERLKELQARVGESLK